MIGYKLTVEQAKDLENQEFSETQLNTLMKEYNTQKEDKDAVFENRKKEKVNMNNANVSVDDLSQTLSEVDPWTQKNVISNE
jgi:bisphosphoglycerate-dependent phosphoglycerate mutase